MGQTSGWRFGAADIQWVVRPGPTQGAPSDWVVSSKDRREGKREALVRRGLLPCPVWGTPLVALSIVKISCRPEASRIEMGKEGGARPPLCMGH